MEREKQKTTIKMASSNPIISIIKFSNNKQERLLNCRQKQNTTHVLSMRDTL